MKIGTFQSVSEFNSSKMVGIIKERKIIFPVKRQDYRNTYRSDFKERDKNWKERERTETPVKWGDWKELNFCDVGVKQCENEKKIGSNKIKKIYYVDGRYVIRIKFIIIYDKLEI